jgi:Uma2 family endonuclease
MTARVGLTYQDYAALPDDGKRYEIHDGELSLMAAPSPLRDRPDETTILQPDVLFLDRERLNAIRERAIEGPPTLVVEILSPSTALTDRTRKRELYARYGVPYLWFVDSDTREITAHVLDSGEYRLAARASEAQPVDLPPFVDLGLVPSSLWL